MLFQTPLFLAFFLGVLLLSAVLGHRWVLRQAMLLVASYVFYMAWNQWYIWLIVFSTLLDYGVGAAIARSSNPGRRKALLMLSLAGNLGVLAVFKYYDFFTENIEALCASIGVAVSAPTLDVLLPVGISFYTFQTLSYTLDIYRGQMAPAKSLLKFALFVSFFPQLVAGPIVRAREFLPQLDREPQVSAEQASSGLYLVLKGLVKKVVFADVLGQFLVDPVFADPAAYGGFWVVLGVVGFKLQIYCDFSGYSDIAIGCGRILGFDLPKNFRSPYKAASVAEYWSRWHMTLGSWIRDYVFFPLGGSRGSGPRVVFNIMVTFLLVGLWHGASWTFVLWGAYYGFVACIERFWVKPAPFETDDEPLSSGRVARVCLTLFLTSIASVLFRATDLAEVGSIIRAIAEPTLWAQRMAWPVLAVFLLAAVTHFFPEEGKQRLEDRFVAAPAVLQALVVVGVLIALRLANVSTNPFYYFQF